MKFQEFYTSEIGKYILSALLGLGLASFFRSTCEDSSCTKYIAPKELDVQNISFGFDDKCFKFQRVNNISCAGRQQSASFNEVEFL